MHSFAHILCASSSPLLVGLSKIPKIIHFGYHFIASFCGLIHFIGSKLLHFVPSFCAQFGWLLCFRIDSPFIYFPLWPIYLNLTGNVVIVVMPQMRSLHYFRKMQELKSLVIKTVLQAQAYNYVLSPSLCQRHWKCKLTLEKFPEKKFPKKRCKNL